jgi:hypothetical protein
MKLDPKARQPEALRATPRDANAASDQTHGVTSYDKDLHHGYIRTVFKNVEFLK